MDTAEETTPKKARRRAKQTKFVDTFDELPDEVQQSVKLYTEALTQRMAWQDNENTYRADLLSLMKKHNLKFVPDPDDDEKVFALTVGEPEEKVKKIKKSAALAETTASKSKEKGPEPDGKSAAAGE